MDDNNYQILSQLRNNVISKMRTFFDKNNERFFSDYELSQLSKIEVSFLTKNSISRHGLTTNSDKSKKISTSSSSEQKLICASSDGMPRSRWLLFV